MRGVPIPRQERERKSLSRRASKSQLLPSRAAAPGTWKLKTICFPRTAPGVLRARPQRGGKERVLIRARLLGCGDACFMGGIHFFARLESWGESLFCWAVNYMSLVSADALVHG